MFSPAGNKRGAAASSSATSFSLGTGTTGAKRNPRIIRGRRPVGGAPAATTDSADVFHAARTSSREAYITVDNNTDRGSATTSRIDPSRPRRSAQENERTTILATPPSATTPNIASWTNQETSSATSQNPTPAFEIRVALIGHVSVGKTTVLNALFREKYSEVSMQRTTAGVNFFHITTAETSSNKEDIIEKSMQPTPQPATIVLDEISRDNQVLRDLDTVQEKTFNIELQEQLLPDIKDDTKLVFVDIPGINEAGTNNKYAKYVNDHWHTFDCIVLVMDGRQGVNTDAQIDILNMVKKNFHEIRKIPIIILCNKIDDPEDEEQEAMINEMRAVVENIFFVSDRIQALSDVVNGQYRTWARSFGPDPVFSPAFLPISAVQAFMFRSASMLEFEEFKKKFDSALMNKLGREAYGRQWKHFTDEEKITTAYTLVKDPEKYREGVEASNFHLFLNIMKCCLSGEANQVSISADQLYVASKRLETESVASNNLVKELRQIYDRAVSQSIPGFSHEELTAKFLEINGGHGIKSIELFTGPEEVHHLAAPMTEILDFAGFLQDIGELASHKVDLIKAAKGLVLQQAMVLLDPPTTWQDHNFSAYEWVLLLGPVIVQMSASRVCAEHFSFVKIHLERLFHVNSVKSYSETCPRCNKEFQVNIIVTGNNHHYCDSCKLPVVKHVDCPNCVQNGNQSDWFVRRRSSGADSHVFDCEKCGSGVILHPGVSSTIKISQCDGSLQAMRLQGGRPKFLCHENPGNPHHMGHLVWKFCILMDMLEHCEKRQCSNQGLVYGVWT